ncbi:MAG: hypothetical protein U1F65_06520 [Verrucomicrobiota bacterium]
MKPVLVLAVLLLVPGWLIAGEAVRELPETAPTVVLHDQFDTPQRLSFPTTNLTFLTIADRRGSEQIAGWVAPIQHRFGSRISICGIADVSAVPRFMRGFIKRQFQRAQTHPVMLDWSGDAVRAFAYSPDKVNVLVIDGAGKILKRLAGPADETLVKEVGDLMDAALKSSPAQNAPASP